MQSVYIWLHSFQKREKGRGDFPLFGFSHLKEIRAKTAILPAKKDMSFQISQKKVMTYRLMKSSGGEKMVFLHFTIKIWKSVLLFYLLGFSQYRTSFIAPLKTQSPVA